LEEIGKRELIDEKRTVSRLDWEYPTTS
jgi:hypothetical protein